uniref:NACHT domain-containing protein n=1 Tax=Pygocentrus nattereri TaxID=42514 RepID=A0AAR2J8B2_PYGNA
MAEYQKVETSEIGLLQKHSESERYQSGSKSRGKLQKKIDDLFNIFDALERKIIGLVKHELEMYKKLLRRQNTKYNRKVEQSKGSLRHEVLNITVSFLRDMEHEDLADALQNEMIELIQRPLKKRMKEKCLHVYEGIAKQGESTSLNTIYTDLYITEGGAGQVNKEHEVRLIEKNNVRRDTNQMEQEVQITCVDMFKPLPEEDKPIRTVLTQGVAGIGKSICVQKFILDWAEGIKYQDIQLIFPLPFRELNLKKKGRHSLMDIIYLFFPETKGLRLSDQNNVLFIFDGLDECQLPLAFQKNEILNNVSTSAPLDAVLTNLIKGNLLPSALIWITTRPAATSKIPAECIDRVTEVRGFNDEQKEEYFRKRIGDQDLASKIIDHIKESRSLHIMCHIPVFCWISATVLQRILEETDSEETPKTLTQMYTCFLIYQTIQGNVKYTGKNALDIPWDKEGIHSLGKLAFQHLKENSLIFYSTDLDTCGIDPSKISVYSGLCTQETVRFQDTVYSFVHLSIQEFLAAVFGYISLRNNQKNVLDHQSESQESKKTEVIDFLKTAVDEALKSDHGHLDLFLRFLLGLSLESNEKLIQGLLTQKGSRSDCQKDIVEYIKLKFKENPSPERSINLFYCLNELNDDSLVKEIQSYMNSGRLSEAELSPAQWSALVFVLLTSKEKLEVFDLKKFIRSDECLIRLQSVLKEATSALLSECNLTKRSCSALSKVLSSESSKLTLLDLSGNPIQDRGVELLSAGLESANCKLETLGLSFCSITEEGYAALASTLKSNPSSHLMELDLTGNDPGDTGVQKLINLPDDPNSKLKKLRLLKSSTAEEACDSVTKVLGINPLLLRELDLSGKLQGDSEMKKISDLLQDSHCRPNKLLLNKCSITEEGCAALSSALYSNPSHLIELDLSENQLGTSGVKKICEMLKNPQSVLQHLQLSFCSITEEGYAALASALKSKPSSHLMELDLSGNDPGDTGVKKLINLLDDPNSKLKKLRLLKSSTAEEACDSLTKVLGINPLLLRELDLSGKLQGDSEMKKISDLLEDSHCRPNKLLLNKCTITKKGCPALSSALCSNLSHLIELDLSENLLGNSGVKKICEMLKNPQSVLQKLQLSFCSITEEGYAALASALKSNPSSHLMELDLTGNDPGDTGVQKIIKLLDDPNSKLKKLRLLKSSTAEEVCDSLTKVLGINPLLLRELDLSGKLQGDSEMKKISDLLEDSHCRPNKLLLNKNSITMKGCAALSSALCSNPSHLIELDLSDNLLGTSGVKKICEMLKNPQSVLQKLQLSFCSITEEGYAALGSALKSNRSSHLIELDIRGNNPGDTGVKKLVDLQDDPNSNLKKLRLLNSSMAEEVCDSLTKVLGINPLLLRELDLSGKLQGDSEMKKISDLLEDSHCRPNKLLLNKNSITKKGCAALSSALCSNPSHLIELDLSENQLGTSGVKKICSLLNNHYCKLQNLGLSFCSITQEGYAALASSLKSNPSSQLIELDLRGNNPGDRGVKMLTDLLEDSNCQLKKTRLLNSSAAEEVCDSLTKVLGINPLLLSDLDLSGKIQGDSEMRKVSDLLEDSHCRTQKLKLNKSSITEEGCAALSSALCSNPSHLIELDLSQNELGDSGVKKICSLLNNQGCKLMKVGLSFCSITEEGYAALASALTSNRSSHLKELDLRGNDPGHTGVKKLINLLEDTNSNLKKLRFLKAPAAEEICDSLTKVVGTNPLLLRELDLSGKTQGVSELQQLCSLLEDAHCKIEKLGLSNCSIIPESCAVLASILSLDSSSVRKMDLSNNNLQDSGMQHLTGGLTNANCKLEIMMLKTCALTKESCSALADVLNSKYSHLNELDMSNNNLEDSGVVQLSAGLKDPHSSLKIIRLSNSSITEDGCGALASALKSNPSHLMDLDLSENIVENSGVKQLCDLLMNSNCMLQKLNLSFCRITEDGYVALASTLKSNPSSHLIELDLRGNDPGDTGVKKLTDLLEDPNCKLKTLRLLKSFAAEEACGFLTKALGINPLLLRDLDLSGKTQGDSGMKKLCDLLEDSHCKTRKLKLNKSSITEEGCAALSSALCSNPSHLIELDLSENQLGTSGVKKICGVLGNTLFKLSKLELGNCSITDEGCAALASAFRTNPLHLRELNLSGNNVGNFGVKHLSELLMHSQSSLEKLHLSFCTVTEEGYAALASSLKSKPSSHLIQLDLRGNNPGDTGVKKLMDLLDNPNCKLKTLRLLKSSIEEEVCDSLTKVLGISPLLLTELDLSGKIQGNSEMKKLSDLLEDSHCRPKTLKINKSSITEEGCAALSSALCSNPSHLIELDLSENQLGDSGVKKICSLLKKSNCKLSKLNLSFCNVTEGGYTALSSALKSNSSSHLVELDLRGNNPGDRGVKMLTDLVDDPNYKLKTLRLLNSSTAEEFCDSLTKALGKNPLLLRELDLSGKIQGDSGMKKLSDLLEDSHCRITKLLLTRGSITAEGCAALASALCSNPSHLIELDLSENQLGDSGVKKICSLLNTLHCKLKKLNLSFCSLTEKGYVALASALKSSPSSLLTELDLRGNNPGDTGVKILTDIFGDSRKTLRLLKSSDAEEACTFLNKSLGQNPLLQRELDLSRTELKDIKVKQLCALLEDPHYRLEKLT